jgi:hypothetical protein
MSAVIVDQITLECLMNRDMYKKLMTNKTVIAQKNKEKDFYKNRISHLTEELLLNNEVDGLFVDVTFAFENYVKTCIHYFKIIDESDIIQNDYNGLEGQSLAGQNVSADETVITNEDEDASADEDTSNSLDNGEGEDEEDIDEDEDLDKDEDGDVDEDLDEDIYVEVLEDEEEEEHEDLEDNKDDDKMKMMMHSARMMTGTLDKFMMLKQPTTAAIPPKKKCADVLPTQKEINLENPDLMNKGICKKKNMNNKYGK